MVDLVFGRRIRQRMVFQLSAGPQEILLRNFVPPINPIWTWNLTSSLMYQLRRTTYSLMYMHGTTNGSGVFFSATTDMVTATASRQLSAFWTASATAGYDSNQNLASIPGQTGLFNGWFVGLNASRPIGPHFLTSFFYGAQKQIGTGGCPVANCANGYLWQTFGGTLTWHPRPIALR